VSRLFIRVNAEVIILKYQSDEGKRKAMLKIRKFRKDIDEQVWVEVLNVAYREFKDWRTITIAEFLARGKYPDFKTEGRFIAELNGQPVGIVHAYVDEAEGEMKGLIEDLAVIPKFRNSGVENELVKSGMNELKRQGAIIIRVSRIRWSYDEEKDRIAFLEKLGFKLIRRTSLMEISLTNIPPNIQKNMQVVIAQCQTNADRDIKLLTTLRNECNREQFNFRQTTFEETRHFLMNNPYSYFEIFFAMVNHESIGYVVIAIDEKYNIEKNIKAGIILGVGVLEAHRLEGVGTRLVWHGLSALKAKGMTKAGLDVDDFNQTGALRLYKKLGFKVVEKYLTYEKILDCKDPP
jgi:ribosomal protein S18 acetylase RimI-like enzyme